MQLEEAVKAFEARFTTVRDGMLGPEAIPGLPYTVIGSGGGYDDDHRLPCYCTNEAAAVRLWLEAAIAFAQGKPYLYWRTRPQLDFTFMKTCDEDGRVRPIPEDLKTVFGAKKLWVIYSRFAVAGD